MKLKPRQVVFAVRGFIVLLMLSATSFAQTDARRLEFTDAFKGDIKPLLARFCHDCHTGDEAEAEIDLASFKEIGDLQKQTKLWQKVSAILESGQMPPKEADQPSRNERDQLETWVHSFLLVEAEAHAGDPGPVTLRRLSNAEYTYTIRDLTGVESLDPAREFPIDGAAGEGFTNTGDALVMSPALVQKYLAAAKDIASHAVLTPDGIRFSKYNTERDWTDERLADIQRFYAKYADTGGGKKIELHGLTFDTDQGGQLPLENYLRATLLRRDEPDQDVVALCDLNAKYFAVLWQAFAEESESDSFLMNRLRARWQVAKPDDVTELANEIREWQAALWKFNVVGHIGRDGTASRWMEPNPSLHTSQEFRVELPTQPDGEDVFVYLATNSINPATDCQVVWRNARLEAEGQPTVPLAYAVGVQRQIDLQREQSLKSTARCLAAVAEAASEQGETNPSELAKRYSIDEPLLQVWLEFLSVVAPPPINVSGHFTEKILSTQGHNFVTGWGSPSTPSVVANSSDDAVYIPGEAPPHSVLAHPSPTHFAAAGWQSPIAGRVRIDAKVADAHGACGNGQQWTVRLESGNTADDLWTGEFDTQGTATMPPKTIDVYAGDLVSFMLMPRGGDFECDLTHFNLVITEVGDEHRVWNLTTDVSSDILASNPHSDGYGKQDVWHFYSGPVAEILKPLNNRPSIVPAGSLLAAWNQSEDPEEKTKIAEQIQSLVLGPAPPNVQSPDAILRRQIRSLTSEIDLAMLLKKAAADDRFQDGTLMSEAPGVIEFQLPRALVAGRSLVVTAECASDSNAAQFEVSLHRQDSVDRIVPTRPTVARENSAAIRHLEAVFDEFRQLFPPALCYARIVPIDEVVTLTLYFREDDHLQRLMLDKAEVAELNHLWDELLYVAQEPLKYEVAFEQLQEFATQDRPDHVIGWKVHVDRTKQRIADFRQRLLDTEHVHLQAVVDLAARAWRKPLTENDENRIRDTYTRLREHELTHNEAIRLTIARVLTAPSFLYRLEKPGSNSYAEAVSNYELAIRLSYFLWSSMPDEELLRLASEGKLTQDETLVAQTKRMLSDMRTRRMAIHFACQWLDIRDFDKNVEKNERLFPEFVEMRSHMYDESVRFFEHMFRHDGSILDVLKADHTFLNEKLAKHYGIDHVAGDWQKYSNARRVGRGGVLGMATVLAHASGASRTSPILRGNWVSETLLGERLPRPPTNVPQLPEEIPSGLTERELIEQHSSVPECAECHARIDPYGFALEQYDAIGRIRSSKVDTKTKLFDGQMIDGLDGLREYLATERRDDFLHQFCKKLLGYALGREVQLSDEPLLAEMKRKLGANEFRFHMAVEEIVSSPQFRNIRGTAWSVE